MQTVGSKKTNLFSIKGSILFSTLVRSQYRGGRSAHQKSLPGVLDQGMLELRQFAVPDHHLMPWWPLPIIVPNPCGNSATRLSKPTT